MNGRKIFLLWLEIILFIVISKEYCFGQRTHIFNLLTNSVRGLTSVKGLTTNLDNVKSYSNKHNDSIYVPGKYLNTTELIKRRGYQAEEYKVITDDGYKLQLTRIVTCNLGPYLPVLFIHGVFATSEQFLMLGHNHGLASILADNGFDVWLGDQRGDVYSRSHVKYQPNNPKFWNFSFQEDGIYDIPAFVNKIKEITKAPQVSFIGHSMGGTVFLVTGAERPDYAAKNIRLSVLLGPFYPPKIYKTGFLDIFMRNADFIVKTHTRAKQFEFLPRSRLMQRLSEIFCKPNLVPGVCLTMIGMIAGDNRNNVDINMAHLYSSSMVAGTSLKTYEHLAQVYKSGKFQKYDYGAKGNIEKYGQSTPPLYKLENIQTPIIIAYGKNDGFLDKPTVEILTRVLPNVIKAHEAKDPKFTHTDFVFGNSAKILVYDQILDIMKNMTRIDQ